MAAMESPPPMRENAPEMVATDTQRATEWVPFSKFGNSYTPTGPFHRIVLAVLMMEANFWMVRGPMSMPSQPSGMSLCVVMYWLALLSNLSAQMLSMGK